MEFYKNVSKALLLFNLISIFFLILTIFSYSLIQYMFQPLVSITNMLFDDPVVIESLIQVLNLAMMLPELLDYAFLILVIILIFDLFSVAWKTNTSSLYGTLMFSMIGLPVWVFFMEMVTQVKTWAVNFLGSAISYNTNLTFYTYIQNNSLEFSIWVFIIAIAINSIDWGNIKVFNKIGNPLSSTNDEKGFNDRIQQ